MAYSIRKKEIIKYRDEEHKVPLVYYEFNCDEVSDLPINPAVDGEEIAQGSIAWVISTGEFYGYTSTGSWVNQTTLEPVLTSSALNALSSTRRKLATTNLDEGESNDQYL